MIVVLLMRRRPPRSKRTYTLCPYTTRFRSPRAMRLLCESRDRPHTVQGLPASVAGYVPMSARPEVLQASARLVLAGGNCFPLRTYPISPQQSLLTHFEPDRKSTRLNSSH